MKKWTLLIATYAILSLTGCAGVIASASSVIPEALAMFLFGSGLIGIAGIKRHFTTTK